jgi:hypothetical protein
MLLSVLHMHLFTLSSPSVRHCISLTRQFVSDAVQRALWPALAAAALLSHVIRHLDPLRQFFFFGIIKISRRSFTQLPLFCTKPARLEKLLNTARIDNDIHFIKESLAC